MNKILSAVIGGFLGVTMATAIGVGMAVGSKAEYKEAEAAETTVSWTYKTTVTSGYTFVRVNAKEDNTNNCYLDKDSSTGLDVYVKRSSGNLWTSAPTTVSLTAKIGGGTNKNPLGHSVTAYFIDSSGNRISSAETTVTNKVENTAGKEYTVSLTPVDNAYGIQIHHTKDSSYNIRLFSFSITYTVQESGGGDDDELPEGSIRYRHIFNAKPSTGNGIALSGINWNITATNLGSYNSANYAGVQIGSSSTNGSIQLTSSSVWGGQSGSAYYGYDTISKIRLWLNLGGTSVTPTVSVGGTAATSDGTAVVKNSHAGSDYTKATKVTFTPNASHKTGSVVINVSSVKAGYICAIEIDCEESSPTTKYEYTDVITRYTTGIANGSNTYANWSGKKLSSAAIYAGKSAGSYNTIQINTKNSDSGIVTTTSGGTVKSIVLNINSNSSVGRKIHIYGKNTAYTSPSDLFSSETSGSSLGTDIEYVSGTTEYTFTPSSYCNYIGIRGASNAIYIDSIAITWQTTTEIAAPTSLTVDTMPTNTHYGVGEKLDLTGLVVKDNTNVATINYTTEPADGYTFVAGDVSNAKVITVRSLRDSTVTTSFTIEVVSAYPTSLIRTAPIAYSNDMTLAQGTGRFTAKFTDGSEVTNIKIGDTGTSLSIGGETVSLSDLARNHAGERATLSYTNSGRTVTYSFNIVVEDDLLVDYFRDVPNYVLSGESATISAHYTSFIGKPNVEVTALEPSNLSVSFNANNVTYDADTDVGEIPFTVTGGSTAGQYTIQVTISLNGETASNTCSVTVRTAAPGHEGSGDYTLITSLSDITTGRYVIAANVDGTYQSMGNVLTNNHKFDGREISVNNSGAITSSSAAFDIFDLTRTGDNVTIQDEDTHKYVRYSGSSTNLSFELDNPYNWTVSESESGVGTFRFVASTTSGESTVRGLGFHASDSTTTYNKFGPFAVSGYKNSAKSSTHEYYEIELFKYVGDPEEDTGADEFNMVKDFVDTYMHMDDIATTTLDNGNACMGANGLYATAKAGWNTMMSSYTGSYTASQIKGIFQNQFPDAYERYVTWAAKNGENETQAFNGQAFVPSNSQPTRVIDVNNNAMPAIIITISFVTVSTIAGYYLLKKKKQK